MAVYDGFFDAVQNEDTGEYDRAYGAGDLTNYFANMIGSGVCIHDDPNSFKVRLEDGKAVVSPGYLFIRGYWCKNDSDLPIDLPGTSSYAVVAHLDLSKRMIELQVRSVSQAYPDSLVLAIVSPSSSEDTRHNTDICGIIDTAGELSKKVEWAIGYIDTEIEDKLAAVEQDINAQAAKLDAKIAEVQAVADSIVPPPVGSIKFSASQNVGPEWLRCDGSFINEADYPELVAALGKLTPSGDKFQLISDGEIGPQITNGVVYAGRMWVYSYSTKKLYGVDLEGKGGVKEIAISSNGGLIDNFLTPLTSAPLALSIVSTKSGKTKVFLAQILQNGSLHKDDLSLTGKIQILSADFDVDASAIELGSLFSDVQLYNTVNTYYQAYIDKGTAIPYIASAAVNGVDMFYCALSVVPSYNSMSYLEWNDGDETPIAYGYNTNGAQSNQYYSYQRAAFTEKSYGEMVSIISYKGNETRTKIESAPSGMFKLGYFNTTVAPDNIQSNGPMNIVGSDRIIIEPSLSGCIVVETKIKSQRAVQFQGVSLPNNARVFVDAGAYLWGKDIFMIFVGTGIIFSRDLTAGSFGYLDTTSVLGTITQFGYLDYSQDEGTLYLLGQDTTNKVKVAKIVLDTLYDYANDGAWLPMIASDGVPAYIKAKGDGEGDTPVPDGDVLTVTVKGPAYHNIAGYAAIEFNGDVIGAGTYRYRFAGGTGTFNATIRVLQTTTQAISLNVNGSYMVTVPEGSTEGTKKSVTLNVAPYMASGVVLQLGIPG